MIPGQFSFKNPRSARNVKKLCVFFSSIYLWLLRSLRSLLSSLVCSVLQQSKRLMNWSVWKYLPWLRTSFARGNPLLCRPSIWVHGAMCILRAFKARLIIALGNFKYRGQWAPSTLLSRYFGDLGNQTGFCLLSHTKYRLDLAKEQIELNIFMMKVLHTGATVQSMFKNSGLIWWNLAEARIWICRSKEQKQWNIRIFAQKSKFCLPKIAIFKLKILRFQHFEFEN